VWIEIIAFKVVVCFKYFLFIHWSFNTYFYFYTFKNYLVVQVVLFSFTVEYAIRISKTVKQIGFEWVT